MYHYNYIWRYHLHSSLHKNPYLARIAFLGVHLYENILWDCGTKFGKMCNFRKLYCCLLIELKFKKIIEVEIRSLLPRPQLRIFYPIGPTYSFTTEFCQRIIEKRYFLHDIEKFQLKLLATWFALHLLYLSLMQHFH